MNSNLLLETSFGKLEVEIYDSNESRTITFEEGSLTISGLNIRSLIYTSELQTNLQPFTARSFEKYLLGEARSFKRENAKEIVERFNLNNCFLPLSFLSFFLDDSATTWFAISTSSNDKRLFKLEIWGDDAENIDNCNFWEITVGEDSDILVSALEYVCLVAKAIHDGKLSDFIIKMNMVIGG